MAAGVILGYVGRWKMWLGVWTETQSHVGVALLFGMPAAAGVGAWVGASFKRGGIELLASGSSKDSKAIVAHQYLCTIGWTCSGLILGSLPAFIATLVVPHYGQLSVLALLPQLAIVAAFTAMGQLIGRHLPWFLGAPICAVGSWVLLAFFDIEADNALLALTPVDERWMTFQHIKIWVVLTQTALWALVLAYVVTRRAGAATSAVACLFLAGLFAAPLLYATPATRAAPSAATAISCHGRESVRVCLPAAKHFLLHELDATVRASHAVLDGLQADHIAYVDDETDGLSPAANRQLRTAVDEQRAGERQVVLLSSAGGLSAYTRIDRPQLLLALGSAEIPPSTVESSASSGTRLPKATPSDVVLRWYCQRLKLPIDGTDGGPLLGRRWLDYASHQAEIKAFEAMSDSQRKQWLSSHRQNIHSGALTWNELATAES